MPRNVFNISAVDTEILSRMIWKEKTRKTGNCGTAHKSACTTGFKWTHNGWNE